MRKILKKLRLLCTQWGISLRQFLSATSEQTTALKPLVIWKLSFSGTTK